MTLHIFLDWLNSQPFAVAIAESDWLFPTIETAHVFALTMVVGSIAMVDLRLLRAAGRDLAVSQLTNSVLPWTWGSFLLALITGVLLFASKAPQYVTYFPFVAKMALLVLAGANMLLFHFITYRSVRDWDTSSDPPIMAKIAGGSSLLLWCGIVVCGRWIGFV